MPARPLQGVDAQRRYDFRDAVVKSGPPAVGCRVVARLDDAVRAREQFTAARGLLRTAKPSLERDFIHRDLAVDLTALGGSGTDVTEGLRVKWDETQDEIRRALEGIQSPEIRAEAVRAVARELAAREQQPRAAALARLVSGAAGPHRAGES